MSPWRFQVTIDIITLHLLIIIIGLFIWIQTKGPRLTHSGPLAEDKQRYLVIGAPIAASLVTRLVSGRIQAGFLRSFESRLRRVDIAPTTESQELQDIRPDAKIQVLDRQWRGALGIDDWSEKWKNWMPLLTFLLCGLITTTVVTIFTPTTTSITIPYHPIIPDTSFGEIFTGYDTGPCVGIADESRIPENWFNWTLYNGSAYYCATNGSCPPNQMLAAAPSINSENPDDYIYVDSGVAVERSALGASTFLYKSPALNNLTKEHGFNLANTTQCVPVMTSNPVHCKTGGKVKVMSDHELHLEAMTDYGFVESRRFYQTRGFPRDSGMINGMSMVYPLGVATTGDEGLGVGVSVAWFGAYTDVKGIIPFANLLARAVNDSNNIAGLAPNATYVVSCTSTRDTRLSTVMPPSICRLSGRAIHPTSPTA